MHTRQPTWDARTFSWALLLAAAVGGAVPLVFATVYGLGRNIPPHDLATGYLVAFVWAVALAGALYLVPMPEQHRPLLLGLWVAKIGVTLGFELVYEAKYTILDAYYYFDESRYLEVSLESFRFGHGTQNMIVLTRMHLDLFPDSFHMLKVTWAMIGLLGVYAFYRAFVLYAGHEDSRLFWILGLCPSILFWSSTFGKDPLAMLSVALYTYGFVRWRRSAGLGGPAWMLAGIFVAVMIRMWLIPLLFTPLVVLGLLGVEGVWKRVAIVTVSGLGLWAGLQAFLARVGFGSVTDVLRAVDTVSKASASGGSSQMLDLEGPVAILKFLPLGMFTALFRPLPGDVMNAFGLLAGLENLVLVGLLVVAAWRTRWRDLRPPMILCAVVFILAWSMFYSVISYINLGGAARFKLQVLPIMLTLLIYLARNRDGSPGVDLRAG